MHSSLDGVFFLFFVVEEIRCVSYRKIANEGYLQCHKLSRIKAMSLYLYDLPKVQLVGDYWFPVLRKVCQWNSRCHSLQFNDAVLNHTLCSNIIFPSTIIHFFVIRDGYYDVASTSDIYFVNIKSRFLLFIS